MSFLKKPSDEMSNLVWSMKMVGDSVKKCFAITSPLDADHIGNGVLLKKQFSRSKPFLEQAGLP